MEKRVSREGWRKAPKGKTGIVREAGNDNSFHPTPSLAGRWGKERAGRAKGMLKKRYHQQQSSKAGLFKTQTVLGKK